MFWESFSTGIGVLFHWQTYVASLLFLTLPTKSTRLIGHLIGNLATRFTSSYFWRHNTFVSIFLCFQTLSLSIFVLTMFPLILGVSNEASWLFPWAFVVAAPKTAIMLFCLLLLCNIGLNFYLPALGENSIVATVIRTLLLGNFALVLIVPIFDAKDITYWPGFWFVIGLLVIGWVMEWLGLTFARILATIINIGLNKIIDTGEKDIGLFFAAPVSAAFGFIPVFIYGVWLSKQLLAN